MNTATQVCVTQVTPPSCGEGQLWDTQNERCVDRPEDAPTCDGGFLDTTTSTCVDVQNEWHCSVVKNYGYCANLADVSLPSDVRVVNCSQIPDSGAQERSLRSLRTHWKHDVQDKSHRLRDRARQLQDTAQNIDPAVRCEPAVGLPCATLLTRPAQLRVAAQPASAKAGSIFTVQPRIEVRDAGGGLLTEDSQTQVVVTVESGGGAVFYADTPRPAEGDESQPLIVGTATKGVVQFEGLVIDAPGDGYVLKFTVIRDDDLGGGEVSAVTAPFNVWAFVIVEGSGSASEEQCEVADAGGECCASGKVDACGVCDGNGASCVVEVELQIFATSEEEAAALMDADSPERAEFEAAFVAEIAAYLGISPSRIVITNIEFDYDISLGRRRLRIRSGRALQADEGDNDAPVLAVTFELRPPPNADTDPDAGAEMEAVTQLLVEGVTNSESALYSSHNSQTNRLVSSYVPSARRVGLCGNGECEVGESASCSDCEKSNAVCGNGECELDLGETSVNCVADCEAATGQETTDDDGEVVGGEDDGLSGAAIAGIVVAGVAVVGGMVGISKCVSTRAKKQKPAARSAMPSKSAATRLVEMEAYRSAPPNQIKVQSSPHSTGPQ